MPEARVATQVLEEEKDLLRWLSSTAPLAKLPRRHGGVHLSHVIRGLTTEASRLLPMEDFIDAAVVTVFGGANQQHCDNQFLFDVLITHGPMPVDGFVFYAEAASASEPHST